MLSAFSSAPEGLKIVEDQPGLERALQPDIPTNARVALFATCLASFFRPSTIRAAEKLLRAVGFAPQATLGETCCGQPNLNSGDRANAQRIALHHMQTLADFDYVVVPSGSCTGTIVNQYSALFPQGSLQHTKARALAARTFELTAFLAKFAKRPLTAAPAQNAVTVHDSCSCFRELNIATEPRQLLAQRGIATIEATSPESCCGFGGVFSVKFGEISSHLAEKKCQALIATGAKTIVGSDLGCLLHLAGLIKAQGAEIEVRHIAEVLADETTSPGIAGAET